MTRLTVTILLVLASQASADGFFPGQWQNGKGLRMVRASLPKGAKPVWLSKRARRVAIDSLYSVKNGNSQFDLAVTTRRVRSGRTLILEWQGKAFSPVGHGVKRKATYHYRVPKFVAEGLAQKYKFKPTLRTKLDKYVRHSGHAPDKVKIGAPIPFRLDVWLQAGKPVAIVNGGRQRGPRNNRFFFKVVSGPPATAITAPDFGGRSAALTLTNKPISVGEDVTRWLNFDKPGRYIIRWKYEGWLTRPKDFPRYHKGWDYVRTGTFTLAVEK